MALKKSPTPVGLRALATIYARLGRNERAAELRTRAALTPEQSRLELVLR